MGRGTLFKKILQNMQQEGMVYLCLSVCLNAGGGGGLWRHKSRCPTHSIPVLEFLSSTLQKCVCVGGGG
jgi:hypothetical protein